MLVRERLGEMENENTHVFCPHQHCAENEMIEWMECGGLEELADKESSEHQFWQQYAATMNNGFAHIHLQGSQFNMCKNVKKYSIA